MKRIIMFVLLFAALKVAGQTTGYLRFDTVRIMKQNGTCELYLINKTKDSLGLLTNVGGGLTQFRRSKMLNDSTIIIGLDTLIIPGGGGTPASGNFIVGAIAPTGGQGSNGDYFLNQQKSQLYKKAGGAWGTPFAYLKSDTVQPFATDIYRGGTLKLKQAWDTAADSWNFGGVARNENHGGNTLLDYKDDPVFNFGWNINPDGSLMDNWKGAYQFHFESNYDTRGIGVPWFERHESISFEPGSYAYTNYTPAERIWSVNASKRLYDIYTYGTMGSLYLQWRLAPGAAHTQYFGVAPAGMNFLNHMQIDSAVAGTNIISIGVDDVLGFFNGFGKRRYLWMESGFHDTTTLMHDAGDFVFQETGGNNTVKFITSKMKLTTAGYDYLTADGNGLTVKGFAGQFNTIWNGQVFGLTMNRTNNSRNAHIDINNSEIGQYMNMYFVNNNSYLDSVINGVNFNIEKFRSGSASSSSLTGTYGYQFNLNDVHMVYTMFTDSVAANGNRLADIVWAPKKTGGSTFEEAMRLKHDGNFLIKSLDTDLIPPTTSGTTKMVITDANGLLSFGDIPGGGTTIYSGDGTLAGNRVVTGNNLSLTLDDIFAFKINSDYNTYAKANGTGIYSSSIVGAPNAYWLGYTPVAGIFSKGAGILIDTNNNVGIGTLPPTTMPLYATGASTFIQGLQSNHGNYYKVTNQTTDFNASLQAYFYTIDATGGNVTVTLPAASTAFGNTMGITYVFQRIDNSGNTVTIQRAGSDTINGATSFTLTTQWESKNLTCTSTSTWAQH